MAMKRSADQTDPTPSFELAQAARYAHATREEHYRALWEIFWQKGDEVWNQTAKSRRIAVPIFPTPEFDASWNEELGVAKIKEHKVTVLDLRNHPDFPQFGTDRWDPNMFLPCLRTHLVVLKDWRRLLRELEEEDDDVEQDEDFRSHICVRGNPGIGKTAFLTYVLLRRLCEGKSTVFQLSSKFPNAYLFDNTGMTVIRIADVSSDKDEFLRNRTVWILTDEKPADQFYKHMSIKCKILMAASPAKANFEGRKELGMTTVYLDMWSWPEIVSAALIEVQSVEIVKGSLSQRSQSQAPEGLANLSPLWIAYWRLGGIPRFLVQRLRWKTLKTPRRFAKEIASIEDSIDEAVGVIVASKLNLGDNQTNVNHSHMVNGTRPESANRSNPSFSTEKRPFNPHGQNGIRTQYLVYVLYLKARIAAQAHALGVFSNLRTYEPAKSFAGKIFEDRWHALMQLNSFTLPKARKVTDARDVGFPAVCGGKLNFKDMKDLSAQLRDGKNSQSLSPHAAGIHIRPTSENQTAFDSFAVWELSRNPKKYRLDWFQCTVSRTHSIKSEGLVDCWNILPACLKNGISELNFVFVVPTDIAPGYREQPYKNGQKKVDRNVLNNTHSWFEKINQLVLGLDDNILFPDGQKSV